MDIAHTFDSWPYDGRRRRRTGAAGVRPAATSVPAGPCPTVRRAFVGRVGCSTVAITSPQSRPSSVPRCAVPRSFASSRPRTTDWRTESASRGIRQENPTPSIVSNRNRRAPVRHRRRSGGTRSAASELRRRSADLGQVSRSSGRDAHTGCACKRHRHRYVPDSRPPGPYGMSQLGPNALPFPPGPARRLRYRVRSKTWLDSGSDATGRTALLTRDRSNPRTDSRCRRARRTATPPRRSSGTGARSPTAAGSSGGGPGPG